MHLIIMMGKLVIRYNDNNNLEQQSTTIKVVKLDKNKDLLQKKNNDNFNHF